MIIMTTQIVKKLDRATREYIEEIVERKVLEFVNDPDEGLELTEYAKRRLLAARKSKGKTIPFEEIKRKYL